jgi:hypothetical protein
MTMTDPITPPPELRQLWDAAAQRMIQEPIAWQDTLPIQAAQWGADQELEACCAWVDYHCRKMRPWISAPPAAPSRRA